LVRVTGVFSATFFFFSSRRRHTRFSRDWSSDVCSSDLLGDGWLIASIALTAAAAGLLIAFVLPRQDELLEELGAHRPVDRAATVQLGMYTGLFNVLWATVTVLMIVRPGSTTGA